MCGIAAMDPHPISQWQTCCDGLKDTSSSTSVGIDVLDFKKVPLEQTHSLTGMEYCIYSVCACVRVCVL